MKRKLLITGATGFVGSVLVSELLKTAPGDGLTLLVLPGEPRPRIWAERGLRVIMGDITDPHAVNTACRGQTHVVHLAGLISYCKRDLPKLLAVNRDGVANIVAACLRHRVRRLVHISSVGAIGFNRGREPADETTPFNWPNSFHYMVSKHLGQQEVERAVLEKGLAAVIINPASIMGPGDPNPLTPHNQLYSNIYRRPFFGSFSGGLAVVDVRDLVALIIKALDHGKAGDKYLAVGANLTYRQVIHLIGKHSGRKVHPWPIPAFLCVIAGWLLEAVSDLTGKKPLLTTSYGRLSGWFLYNRNDKTRREFNHTYIDIEDTIADSCRYFETTFLKPHE